VVTSETENFTYDPLERLLTASGAYSEAYTYNEIGNITSKAGISYTYGSKPHAVTGVGATSYAYDNNGNMTTRGAQTITWDVENRALTVTGGASYVYDGDGNRVKKTEGGQTRVFINKYFEKNVTTGVTTSHYYLGGKEIALNAGGTLSYIQQDTLGGTYGTADASGNSVSTLRFFPYGDCRNSQGTTPTDKKFTGQRLDGTGLYYYGARYYDPGIGRFISADTIVQSFANPQTLNRYSYTINNPLKYIDPSGHLVICQDAQLFSAFIALGIANSQAHDMVRSLVMDMTQIVYIGWGAEGGSSMCLGDSRIGAQLITISSSFKSQSKEELATWVAHESFHANEGYFGTSVEEEVSAYKFQYNVGKGLGLDMDALGGFPAALKNFDPSNSIHLGEARDILKGAGGFSHFTYSFMPERAWASAFPVWFIGSMAINYIIDATSDWKISSFSIPPVPDFSDVPWYMRLGFN
jgi:RHS repeat-associated protein